MALITMQFTRKFKVVSNFSINIWMFVFHDVFVINYDAKNYNCINLWHFCYNVCKYFWMARERKTPFKDEGVGMESSLPKKTTLSKYVILIKLYWISASLFF